MIAIFDFEGNPIEHADGKWSELLDKLALEGLQIFSPSQDPMEKISAYVQNSKRLAKPYRSYLKKQKMFRLLVIWEPPSVEPQVHLKSFQNKFNKIVVFSPNWATTDNSVVLKPSQQLPNAIFPDIMSWQQRDNSFVMIQANKFSVNKGELYSLRRHLTKSLLPSTLKIYGNGWNQSRSKTFWHVFKAIYKNFPHLPKLQGIRYLRPIEIAVHPVESKRDAYIRHRLALVIENDDSYISEKLYDAILSCCLIVYVGGDLSVLGLDSTILNKLHNNEICLRSVMKTLRNLPVVEQYRIAREQYSHLQEYGTEHGYKEIFNEVASLIIQEIGT